MKHDRLPRQARDNRSPRKIEAGRFLRRSVGSNGGSARARSKLWPRHVRTGASPCYSSTTYACRPGCILGTVLCVSGPACSFARFSEEKSLKSPRVRAGARKLVASFVTCAQGYTEAADKRGSGLTISFVGEQWMAGLVLFTALNTVSSFRIDAV